MKCKINDCNLLAMCKELCSKHYYRLKRHGKYDLITSEERFWNQVDKKEDHQCWLWMGAGHKYGTITVKNENFLTHRYSWSLINGVIPPSLSVCHNCDTPLCVNPKHLFLGTPKENTQDMVSKGRSAKGETHGNGKLTELIVLEIRRLHSCGLTYTEIGKQFDISRVQVSNIVNRRQWTHI